VVDRPGMISFAGGLPAAETFPDFGLAAPTRPCSMAPPRAIPACASASPTNSPASVSTVARSGCWCCRAPSRASTWWASSSSTRAPRWRWSPPPTWPPCRCSASSAHALPLHAGDAGRKRIWPQPAGLCLRHPHLPEPHRPLLHGAEREALARTCDEAGVPLFEDDPYRDLVYDRCERRPVVTRRAARGSTRAPSPRAWRRACAWVSWPRRRSSSPIWCASSRPPTCTATASASGWCCSN
jgi:hypothetical protein